MSEIDSADLNQQELTQILLNSKSIAVVGASPNVARPSHWISQYLMGNGYQVIPVNPGHTSLLGVPCFPNLISINQPVDIVNIFRRSDQVLTIVEDALKLSNLKLIWMQDNVINEAAAELAKAAGVPVVMNDCIYRFHCRIS